jgi:hypothetical protein
MAAQINYEISNQINRITLALLNYEISNQINLNQNQFQNVESDLDKLLMGCEPEEYISDEEVEPIYEEIEKVTFTHNDASNYLVTKRIGANYSAKHNLNNFGKSNFINNEPNNNNDNSINYLMGETNNYNLEAELQQSELQQMSIKNKYNRNEKVICYCGHNYTKKNKAIHYKLHHTEFKEIMYEAGALLANLNNISFIPTDQIKCNICNKIYSKNNKAKHFKQQHNQKYDKTLRCYVNIIN